MRSSADIKSEKTLTNEPTETNKQLKQKMQCFQLSNCKCVTLGCIAAERTRCEKKKTIIEFRLAGDDCTVGKR